LDPVSLKPEKIDFEMKVIDSMGQKTNLLWPSNQT